MSPAKRSVDDVYIAILERLGSGTFPLGSKLPSCRRLADDLGSNPSTVSRALQRLAGDGLIRTEERRGSFVTATEEKLPDTVGELTESLQAVVARAMAAGVDRATLESAFTEALDGSSSHATIAFIECNEFDLSRMSQLVENATGVPLKPLLIDDLTADWRDSFDAVAVPLFHLAEVAAVSSRLDNVIELNFLPATGALRSIAMLDPSRDVTVMLPTERGVDRVSSLVRQYFGGAVTSVIGDGDALEALPPGSAVVTTHALGLSDAELAAVGDVVILDWELDQQSVAAFPARVESARRS